MTGQRFTPGLALWCHGLIGIGVVWRGVLRGCGNLLVFQPQRQLIQGLGTGPEAMLVHPG